MSYKAQAMAQNVADELAKRLPSLAVALGVTSGGDISIVVGDGVAGHKNAFVVFTGFSTPLSTNIVGLASEVYNPTVCQLVTEKNYAGTTDNVADILTAGDLLNLLIPLVNSGCRLDWYQSNNGTAPTAAAITGTPAGSAYGSLYGGMRSSQ
jgi:hypothetical protein